MVDAALQGACRWCGHITDPTTQARAIVEEVASEHRVPLEAIYGGDRHAHVSKARGCSIQRIRNETKLTLKAIGDLLDLNHQSVIYHLQNNNGNGTGARERSSSESHG